MSIDQAIGRLTTVGILLVLSLVVTPLARAQCPSVPNTKYTTANINWLINDANRAAIDCNRTTGWAACRRADRLMYDADVGIDQMLRHCTGTNCRKFGLRNLLSFAERLVRVSRTFEGNSGLLRSYANSVEKIRGWERTPMCSAPQPTPGPGRACAWRQGFGGGRACFCVRTNDPTVMQQMPNSYCSGLR